MNMSENLSVGFTENHPVSLIPSETPPLGNQSDDVSMLIETASGKKVSVTNPQASDISIDDIAWALSRIPRFAGHTITEVPYNVAQHSIYVAELLESALNNKSEHADLPFHDLNSAGRSQLLLKALLHDAHEAYTGDIPSPIKKLPELRDTFHKIEQRLDAAIFAQFELDAVTPAEKFIIKHFDKLAQAIEGYQFMPSRGLAWKLPKPSLLLIQNFPAPLPPSQAYKKFLFHFEYLSSQ